jgi:hypothetical protein
MTDPARTRGTDQHGPQATLHGLLELLDRMGRHLRQQHPSARDGPTLRIAASMLDAAIALLGLHAPRTRRDGSLYCAHCLDQAGGHVWPCQTICAFGTALLRRWQPSPPEMRAGPAPPGSAPARQAAEDRDALHEHPWFQTHSRR